MKLNLFQNFQDQVELYDAPVMNFAETFSSFFWVKKKRDCDSDIWTSHLFWWNLFAIISILFFFAKANGTCWCSRHDFFFWTNFLQSFEWNKDCDSDIWMYNFWMLMLLNTVIVVRLCRIGRQPRCTLLRAAARRSATSSAASDAKKKEERILCSRNFSLADNVIIFKPAFV